MRQVGVVVVLGLLALTSCGQVEVRVSTGTFLFEAGQKVALELTGENACPCHCRTIEVLRFSVRDADGTEIHVDRSQLYPVTAGRWTGRWDFTTHGEPIPIGLYELLVQTSLGTFQAVVHVVAPGAAPAVWVEAEASVCGIGLRVYRLVEEGDGPTVSLRVGENLMVALPGNPTTGYRWEVREEPACLGRVPGPEYRSASDLIGGGGTFFFRYKAVTPGAGSLQLVYRRPWEDLPPLHTFSLRVHVP
ncbi:MAG: protease inhibitor I42 family protein [Candidatus Bipolaricaulota bacterium]|nr:protease inhibitor I42 family protein [Candidatus Bipolaricaulota bacterium]